MILSKGKPSIFGITFLLLNLKLIWEWDKDQPYLLFSLLYLSPFFHILEKHLKNLNLNISILSFIDDSLFLMQSKSFQISNAHIFNSYNVAFNLLSKFGLLVKHSKTEVFHFSRSHGIFNPPPLDLSIIGSPILHPKKTWRYLGFIFNRKLLFCQHIDFYTNKAISTVSV